jgi:sugar lactone lactonase YvrE
MKVEVVLRAGAGVGESPVWCDRRKVLWWVDIAAGMLHAFSPASRTNESWNMGQPIGCVALTTGDELLVGLRDGIFLFDPVGGSRALLSQPEAHLPANRPNDAAMSRDGRLFVGTMAQKPDGTPHGHLYRIDPDGSTHRLLDGLHVPNGLAVSPDNGTLYLSDSWASVRRIWAFDLDDRGEISNRRLFFDTASRAGRPDGACVDIDGGYWSAGIDGGELLRLAPDGEVDKVVELPLRKPTKPCFGGADLSTLYVTSLSGGDDGEAAGALLAVSAGMRGLPEPRMKLEK